MELWEAYHPYYMQEGNYYKNGEHTSYESFDDFLAEWGGMDRDLNRVHRFDWVEDEGAEANSSTPGSLYIYFVLQRKARLMSCEIKVTRDDKGKVMDYLKPFAELEKEIWSPLL